MRMIRTSTPTPDAPRGIARNAPHGLRAALNRRPLSNDPGAPADASKTPTTPSNGPQGGAAEDAPRTFSQADLDRIVAREKGKTARELEAAQKRLADMEARDAELGEKAKGADAATVEAARAKRELEKAARERDEHAKTATAVSAKYHATLVNGAVSSALVGLEFIGADAAEVIDAKLRSMARVEPGAGDAADAVYLSDGKTDLDLNDRAAVAAWVRKRFPSLVKAASGSGGPHGAGKGAPVDLKGLSPGQLIAHGLKT